MKHVQSITKKDMGIVVTFQRSRFFLLGRWLMPELLFERHILMTDASHEITINSPQLIKILVGNHEHRLAGFHREKKVKGWVQFTCRSKAHHIAHVSPPLLFFSFAPVSTKEWGHNERRISSTSRFLISLP